MSIYLSFLKYYFSAKNRFQIHSPFVFEFMERVVDDSRTYYCFEDLERLRKRLKGSNQTINFEDFGAKGKGSSRKLTVANLANRSLSRPRQCRELFKLIHWLKPTYGIELGTSLGLSALYQALGHDQLRLASVEGSSEVAKIAEKTIAHFDLKNLLILNGSFEDVLPKALDAYPQLDYAFIDGNHSYEPTLSYFEQCLTHSHEDTFMVFDDIHWSTEMERAWKKIKSDSRVGLSLDLFHYGIVFLNRSKFKAKLDLAVIPNKYKPYRLGFFSE